MTRALLGELKMTVLPEAELAKSFQRDIDSIATSLIEHYSLKFQQDIDHLSSPLMRWLDFRFRYVDPFPREVVYSNKFPKTELNAEASSALQKLEESVKTGTDINPYQGRGLILRNDSSGERKDARTDLLWADWGIHHFHLSNEPIPSHQYFSKPADFLVFCLVCGNVVAIIDVLPHPNREGFANPTLIETVFENWPDYMAQFRLNGILPDGHKSQQEIHALRSNGVNASLSFKGSAYLSPGLGVSSASTPMKLVMVHDRLQAHVRDLARLVSDVNSQFRTPEITALDSPSFSLARTANGLAIYEKNTKQAFLLPESEVGKPAGLLQIIHDLVLPRWACQSLDAHSGTV